MSSPFYTINPNCHETLASGKLRPLKKAWSDVKKTNMGNGAKAQQKRDRKKDTCGVAKSQLKINEKARNISCQICRNTFMCTSRRSELEVHAENKHGKSMNDCFPDFVDAPNKKSK
ncbi:DUF1909-domain-containing protein [Coemansia reversa NRRL 1564]|uniref:DUF1909-domain-containing protein n=1 Tax=Coemansia reversa (strain ATCC 12441 / NRRL 1564) TaxID=763665 RepID=A0A2G5BDN8_COERN|nr:DUF1909-domain-containing protein [Coemansia reversa NRRL 1564]|eukprot:PIA17121.1 DUF1909-domain-containing protein [Coemansia reversa NRRL 1564]